MTENKIHKKGTLGWLKEQAKKDGFENIRDWQDRKTKNTNIEKFKRNIKNVYQLEKLINENKVEIKDKPLFYRFWEKVDIKDNIEECWNWTASTNDGYGQYGYDKDVIGSHRIAYMLTKGEIPDELQVQHLCNNRLCCNPNHLELGNHSKNMQYMYRCRRRDVIGENNGNSMLTEDQVRDIHKIYNEHEWIHEDIGRMFGISKSHTTSIINGKCWHHIWEEFH